MNPAAPALRAIRALAALLRGRAHQAAARHTALPPPGSAQAAARCGEWALAWASHTGPHHLNQDCAGACWRHASQGDGLSAAVADGVTNGAAGDVAALALVRHWLQGPRPPQRQRSFLGAAEDAVAGALRRLTSEPGAATGAACWLQPGGGGWATRVGDCRLLLVRAPATDGLPGEWGVEPLMPDQTYGNLWREAGCAVPPDDDDAGQPARMVGVGSLGEPEWVPLALARGDLLLLASDGLHAALADGDWQAVLHDRLGAATGPGATGAAPQHRLQALADLLIQTAIQRGSEDDITVLAVMRCGPDQQDQQEDPRP